MRELWNGGRVDFEGQYYRLSGASIYDVPARGVPVYIAASGPGVAKYSGRVGDGFICTSGKVAELYAEKLIPSMKEGAGLSGRDPRDIDKMIEVSAATVRWCAR
ncbi:F420-dependent glucose-6-phosphate dehydrogenase Fgd1 [Mycobacteroides abscessus]|nr:F420-dependent glucose-6-phosphate dehydrogenase Fgd1 [Mycobacteroides abscessus]CPS45555.1 F420-dependent glucose-6-phosphate dehydrogenase Fgd1 [Mycobacteroides abscessus]CPS54608.1 F420-dependent glucose-6-phosphate dehydrogenase Fgd1 [Mycobacteroides abscessus]CPT37371.1 F420-dependent glucose-6-phosphate dehydrogenase Fgd1 [Mycobacteroides abscessus]CPT64431.1 F420-dependent glucose-6-phosphate dehydrogenase Fgd1 [Mycobacteroides abscessus]